MATSHKVTDKFLTCTVCMEFFTDPVSLDCQHTFCSKCLITFAKTQPEAIKAKSLPCPVCRKLTKVSNGNKPVEEWTREMKPSFVIQGLIDSCGPGTKDTNFCSYCKQDGETTPATVWCSDCDDALCERCARMHKRIPATQKHDVIGLSKEVKVERKRKVTCQEHTDENVEFLCKDCMKAVCHKCCTLYHRKCDSVVTMESEVPSMKSTLTKAKESLMEKLDLMTTRAEKRKTKLVAVTQSYKQTKSEIKYESQKLRDLIDLKEKKLLDELESVADKEIGQLKADIKTGDRTIQMYQHQSELIDHVMKSDCEMDIYEIFQSCESRVLKSVDDTDTDLIRRTVDRINLKKNTHQIIQVLNNLQLGEIEVTYEGGLDLKATPMLQDTIDVRLVDDQDQAYPCDVTMLNVNGIETVVVTDWVWNKSVKSFYSRNSQPCQSKLKLKNTSWCLTQLKDNRVAITVRDKRQIVIVEVNTDLKLQSTITTTKQYRGITALTPFTIAVGSRDPPSVDILEMTGTVISSLTPSLNSKNILKYPDFLCTSKNGNILVSDNGTNSVLCLTPQGDVVFNYSPTGDMALKNPRGITVTNTGDILLSDWNLHSVLHLTESGQFVRNILTSQDGVSNPSGLCIDRHGRLYVCLYMAKNITVFKMQKSSC